MAGINLSSVISSIQGVSTVWMMEHENHPSTVATPKLLEDLPYPSLSTLASGSFDCVGKFGEGTFSQEGDDATIEDKKYTDGSVAFTTYKKGSYGIKGELHNVNENICKKVLKMSAIAADATTTGSIGENDAIAYDNASGWIDSSVLFIEFDKSNAFKGLLVPKTSIASKFLFKGDSTDNMTIEMKCNFSEAPEKIEITAGTVDFTTKYKGKTWLLIAK